MSSVALGRSIDGARRVAGAGRRWRWLAAGALASVLLVVGGYFAVGAYAYQQLSVVPNGCGDREFRNATPADFQAVDPSHHLAVDATRYQYSDFRTVAFPSRGSSLTIRGWFAPGPRGIAGPAVILIHGRASCRRDPNVMLPAGMLHRAGFAVLLADLRNHGDSDSDNGRWAGGVKEYRDVLGAWDWLVAQGYAPSRIGIFGASLGAAAVAIAIGEEPSVAAAWLDSCYADFWTAATDFGRENGYPDWVAPSAIEVGRIIGDPELGTKSPAEEMLKLQGRPLFLVEGLSDDVVLPHHAVDLAAAAFRGGTKVEPWLVPGAPHTGAMLVVPDEYESRLVTFFKATIGAP